MYMAIHIQDPETDRLARELSSITGLSITQAVNMALQDKLESVARAPHRSQEEYIAGIEAIVRELNKLPILDTRTPEEIIGYNEHGFFD